MLSKVKKDWVLLDNQDTLNPATNLAIEEFAVRQLPKDNSYFFIYQNQPSVIIGRHQNILLEVHLPFCWQKGIPVFRRISGGGSVFHDQGNLNLAFITNYTLKSFNQYKDFLQPVVDYFKEHGLELTIDQRNNVLLKGRKISGNAQFTSKGRMLSHGTLLIESNLSLLRQALKKRSELNGQFSTRATASIESPVMNLSQVTDWPLNISTIKKDLIQIFSGNQPVVYHFDAEQWEQIEQLAKTKFSSWQWTVAESPPLQVRGRLKIKNSIINWEYSLIEGVFKNIKMSDSNLNFISLFLENRPLEENTWRDLQKLLKEKSQWDSKLRQKIIARFF